MSRLTARRALYTLYVGMGLIATTGFSWVVRPLWIGEISEKTALVSTHQKITPVGTIQRLNRARPKAVALSPDGKTLAVLAQGQIVLYRPDGTQGQVVSGLNTGPLGLCWSPDGNALNDGNL